MIKKYRKKPVGIEAIQLTNDNYKEVKDFVGKDLFIDNSSSNGSCIYIKTLEGNMLASPGDYIIKGIKGEFYPCKSDIFEETYSESVEYELSIIHPVNGDVICVTVDTENFPRDNLQFLVDKIRETFPNNDFICIPKNIIDIKIDETVQS